MKIKQTFIDDLIIIEPNLFEDKRGFFYESYNKNSLDKISNIVFVQDNISKSNKGVIRGLHFQKPPFTQTKLVSCIYGKILDVVVDLRKNSNTFGKNFSIELSSKNHLQILVPKGFAHGFQVLSKTAIVSYKVDNFYNSNAESGIVWNDKDLLIDWKQDLEHIISKKDFKLKSFKNLKSPF